MRKKKLSGDGEGGESRVQNSPKAFGELKNLQYFEKEAGFS